MTNFIPEQIWLKDYPVRYAGTTCNARMTVIKLSDSRLMLHSPCKIDAKLKAELEQLGKIAFIIAPGSYHYFHIESAQQAFPDAQTYICPGIERKLPQLKFEGFLSDIHDPRWQQDFQQVLIRGTRYIWEVAMFHIPSKTLLLVDLIENITDQTPGVNNMLKFWWKVVFRMWNNPKPAPEYQLGWKDKVAARNSLSKILDWDFERIIIAHGDLIEKNAKQIAQSAWRKIYLHAQKVQQKLA